jgi:hypothetical protein
MEAWVRRLDEALAHPPGGDPDAMVETLVDLALEREDAGESHLDAHPELMAHAPRLRAAYQAHILAMERRESDRLLALGSRVRFTEAAHEPGLRAYRRVDDLFERVDFARARRFTMVGSGRLPVTALQAAERFPGLAVTALDTDAQAVEVGGRLAGMLGLDNLTFGKVDGSGHGYRGTDIVFIANMVSPKAAALRRVLDTSEATTQVVLREPYGLGRLWTERAEDRLDSRVRVAARGKGSRYLSRNVFLARAV